MSPAEQLFLAFSGGLVIAVLIMVGAAVRAYVQTERRVMIHLAFGFTLIVAATVVTALGALVNNFENAKTLLLVNNGFSMTGYLFVIYSVVSYK